MRRVESHSRSTGRSRACSDSSPLKLIPVPQVSTVTPLLRARLIWARSEGVFARIPDHSPGFQTGCEPITTE